MFEQIEQKIAGLKKESSDLTKSIVSLRKDKQVAEEDVINSKKLFGEVKKELDKLMKKKSETLKDLSAVRSEISGIDQQTKKSLTFIEDAEKDLKKRQGDMDDKEIVRGNLLRTIKDREASANKLFAKAEQANVEAEVIIKKALTRLEQSKVDTEKADYIIKERNIKLTKVQERFDELECLKADQVIANARVESNERRLNSLVKSNEVKERELDKSLVKANEWLDRLTAQELKVKQDESNHLASIKSFNEFKKSIDLKQAKVDKMLDVLLSDKERADKLKKLGM